MVDARIAQYLAKAEECRAEARRAIHDDEKATWLRMAEDWLKLSRGAAHAAAEETQRNTRVDGHARPVHSKIVSR
jgi:hypothetical protein